MKFYLKLYRWAMQMKLHMAMYTFMAVFLKIVCNLLQGRDNLLIWDLVTMWIIALVFAMVESAILPENIVCTKTRSFLWLLVANIFFVGGALMFKWFEDVPLWGGVLLIAFLELGLALMWFGDQFVLKMDSAQLTEELKRYQKTLQK